MWEDKTYWKLSKRRMERRQQIRFAAAVFAICMVLLLVIDIRQMAKEHSVRNERNSSQVATQIPLRQTSRTPSQQPKKSPLPAKQPEKEIYSFLQGPKSWGNRVEWSGEWGEAYMDGAYFGAFGCGLCCVANIYSSLTPYCCSPVDAYHFAKKEANYSGGMAIEWGYMRRSLSAMGFDCHVERKPESYREFCRRAENSLCNLVLVSSNNSSVYWKDTPGHYVTAFLYDKKTERVFLADSGVPEHNRKWVSLKKIYRSLKTSSNWQYITVEGYDKKKDTWRHKKASGTWNAPEWIGQSEQ